MDVLAIDTSSEYLAIGLSYQGYLSHTFDKVGNKQSNFIIPKVQEILQQQDISLEDIDAIAYNRGPGSFTGLRIGLSVAMGMAATNNIKLIPIDSFAIYAQSAKNLLHEKNILVGIDARLNQIYFAGVNTTTFEYFVQPQVINPHEIHIDGNNLVYIGSGFKEYYSQLPDIIRKLEFMDIEYPNALNILQLVKDGHYSAVANDAADLLYLRNKVALNLEEQKQARLK
jgi:tRNA threonylcarbamoyladenosine biosynthesis protein TsaB